MSKDKGEILGEDEKRKEKDEKPYPQEIRHKLIEFYTTKVENHIGYLISTSLAVSALLINFGNSSDLLPLWARQDLLVLLCLGAIYILVRTFYWSTLQGTVTYVSPVSDEWTGKDEQDAQ